MSINAAVRAATLATLSILLSSCVTYKQVKEIVDESNHATIVASLGAEGASLSPAGQASASSNWQEEVERIETFIAENPEQVRTNSALRIREAVILLHAKQANLARAVFAEVECAALESARDRTICDIQDHLMWWYPFNPQFGMDDADRDTARAALAAIAETADGLPAESSIRRALEQMRVRIGLELANSFTRKDDMRDALIDAVCRYEQQFTAQERGLIQNWHLNKDVPAARRRDLLRTLRWYDYVPTAYKRADKINDGTCGTDVDTCPNFSPTWITCISAGNCNDGQEVTPCERQTHN